MEIINLDQGYVDTYTSNASKAEHMIILQSIYSAVLDGDIQHIKSPAFEFDISHIPNRLISNVLGVPEHKVSPSLCRKLLMERMSNMEEQYVMGIKVGSKTPVGNKYRNLKGEEKTRNKKWHITHPDGSTEVTENLGKFCKQHNISAGAMRDMTYHAKRKSHRGFKCKPA